MAEGKNRQWILNARPASKMTGEEFRWNEGRWQGEGRLVQKEDIAVGLENAPRTFMRLFTGKNFGKQLLKIADAAA
jgi:NADPH-dependent curcumin reductase CurA